MSAIDFRVRVNWVRHLKTEALIERFGFEGPFRLLSLWSFAAEFKPKGRLDGMSERQIEARSGWTKKPGLFLGALLELGWLERDPADGVLVLHDWDEEQPFLLDTEERRKRAQDAARKRWSSPGSNAGGNAGGNPAGNANGIAGGNAPPDRPDRPSGSGGIARGARDSSPHGKTPDLEKALRLADEMRGKRR